MYTWDPIATIAANVQSSTVTARENVDTALSRIEELDERYRPMIAVSEKRAIERADHIDEQIKGGEEVGPLAGVPFIAKDNILVFGVETTAGSNILKGFDAPYQSSAIEKLEAAGAICVGKANLDAFGHGSSTENSDFHTSKNPHDDTKVPGGSSGGSAVVIGLGIVPFALGTDTGGSIRLPASFCGIVGYKPTYGIVSRSGVIAMGSSTDVVGPLTRTAADAAQIMDVMTGKDGLDSTMIDRQESYVLKNQDSYKGKKIGVIKEYFGQGIKDGVSNQISESIDKLKALGADIEEVSLPSLPLALAAYYVIVPAELSSNLSRHDGQRYGYSDLDAKNLSDSYTSSRSHGFGAEAKRRIMIGTHVLSSGYYDAYYKKAQTVRTLIVNEFRKAFETYDFLVGPTAPNVAFDIGGVEDPMEMYLTDVMTVAANLAGIPAISVPSGSVDGLPVGLQIIADQKQDAELLQFASSAEGVIL